MNIQKRLDLMVDVSMITIEQARKIQSICSIYEKEFGYSFDEEAAERFITHFAGMYIRENKGQSIETIPEFVLDQLLNDPSCAKANEMLKRLLVEVDAPKEEEGYFLLHLIHFLGQQGNEPC